MVCKNCGNEMRDDARFCPHCGTINNPDLGSGLPQGAAPYSAQPYTGPETPVGKKKTGLFLGLAVAAVAVIAVAAVAVSGLFASPKGQVEKALAKSLAAYEEAEQAMGLPDVSQWQKDQSVFQSMTLGLNHINSQLVGYDMSALSGLEIGASAGYSGEDRYMSAEAHANWDLDELFLFQMVADDAELYFCSPQFTGETYYGVNTETLGADLTEMTGDNSMEDLSFNLFDLVETVLEEMDQDAVEQTVKEANKTLWEAVTVKKEGARTLDVNGTETKTAAYQVIIPQKAMETYADTLIAACVVDYGSLYRELFQSMGMPEAEMEDFLSELDEIDPYRTLSEAAKEAIAELGDLELELCLSDGYVSAVLYAGEISGADVELALYLGGGERYVDDWSATISGSGKFSVEIKSTGDHGLKNGVLTDKTTVNLRSGGSALGRLLSEFRYDPKASGNNLSWSMSIPGAGSLDMVGSLSAGADAISLHLEDISLRVVGMEVCSLRFDYEVLPTLHRTAVENAKLITEMSMAELMAFANELENNAEIWAEEMEALFAARLPAELYYALY